MSKVIIPDDNRKEVPRRLRPNKYLSKDQIQKLRQYVKTQAELFISKHGYPGLKKLARRLRCSDNTLRKAIEKSEKLTTAKNEYEASIGISKRKAVLNSAPESLKLIRRLWS